MSKVVHYVYPAMVRRFITKTKCGLDAETSSKSSEVFEVTCKRCKAKMKKEKK
jgi:hypothetical protein